MIVYNQLDYNTDIPHEHELQTLYRRNIIFPFPIFFVIALHLQFLSNFLLFKLNLIETNLNYKLVMTTGALNNIHF